MIVSIYVCTYVCDVVNVWQSPMELRMLFLPEAVICVWGHSWCARLRLFQSQSGWFVSLSLLQVLSLSWKWKHRTVTLTFDVCSAAWAWTGLVQLFCWLLSSAAHKQRPLLFCGVLWAQGCGRCPRRHEREEDPGQGKQHLACLSEGLPSLRLYGYSRTARVDQSKERNFINPKGTCRFTEAQHTRFDSKKTFRHTK